MKTSSVRLQQDKCLLGYGFIKKSNSSEKNIVVEEELDCFDIDDIGNLEDSPRLVFMNEECGDLIVVNEGGELTENIS